MTTTHDEPGGTVAATIDLDGRVAVVTGAGQGLGRAEALELAGLGARVVVNDYGVSLQGETERNAAQDVVDEIRASGGEAVAHLGDVGNWGTGDELIRTAVDAFGSFDILVNNAGILRDRMIFSMTEDDVDAVLRVHLKGHFGTCRAATAYWRDVSKTSGTPVYARIINTASEAFLIGSPGQPNYAAAKAGIVQLTLAIAASCGKYGVRANAICPRALTRMTDGVLGDASEGGGELAPERVTPLVGYLASAEAERVSGQVFVCYGGFVGLVGAPELETRFDADGGQWTADALADAIGAHYRQRDPRASFAAVSVLKANSA